MNYNLDLVAVWYENNLTESERKAIVGNVAGAMEYGLTRSWRNLTEHVRMVVRREYRRINEKSFVELYRGDLRDDWGSR
jgi:hypothetical protein